RAQPGGSPAGRRCRALALHQLVRNLAQKPRAQVVPAASIQAAPAGEGKAKSLLCARHPHVAETALLLEVSLLQRAHVREDTLLATDHEHGLVLEALGVVKG